ncbi:MAG TPA: hypothetical protein VG963_23800, partial [Polyangiaceae bacterium]|nr:hypothetical protein [Polyangiaceae bacterium]
LAEWIQTKITSLKGLQQGGGKGPKPPKNHAPAVTLKIHRAQLDICVGVDYPMRAVAYDAMNRPVPHGKLTWRSNNPAIASIHPDSGVLIAKATAPGPAGIVAITVTNDRGLASAATIVNVHEAETIQIKTPSPGEVGTDRRLPLSIVVQTATGRSIRDPIISWKSGDPQVVTISPDGALIGGSVGEAEVFGYAGEARTSPYEVTVVKSPAGKPKGGGTGAPMILLSGQDLCPFDKTPVFLDGTHPVVYQRPQKRDYDHNVFWLNLQHPLAEALLKLGEESIQWRSYHFQRLLEVYNTIELRDRFRDSQELDVDMLLSEQQEVSREVYADAQREIFDLLYDDDVALAG